MSLAEIQSYPRIKAIAHTGSREICNPPPMDTDDDWLVLIAPEDKEDFLSFFEIGTISEGDRIQGPSGWEIGGSEPPGEESEFKSLKKGEFNIIMTTDPSYFKYFEAATTVAKKLNLLDKRDRIMLFAAVMQGTKYEELLAVPVGQIQGDVNWQANNRPANFYLNAINPGIWPAMNAVYGNIYGDNNF